jgi:hypothetical protein
VSAGSESAPAPREQGTAAAGGEDFSVDRLFEHLKLRAFLVIDLKVRPFQPECAGLSAVTSALPL